MEKCPSLAACTTSDAKCVVVDIFVFSSRRRERGAFVYSPGPRVMSRVAPSGSVWFLLAADAVVTRRMSAALMTFAALTLCPNERGTVPSGDFMSFWIESIQRNIMV
ncbi:hypothetical protein F2P81_025002 [Scophthalmus maximus]|uniref:Uncharacterized protein n=1 Tax=Scophthalmus maximus TaxID=52904 RepID=A0A6A4RV44_SCOMX|nr:hypothetical protein F2P81_025002 [Scophthalmus maximus]